jgi:hypothetical protein
MKIVGVDRNNFGTPEGILRWAQSVFKAMTHSIAFAQPNGQDAAGRYNAFTQDNIDCILLYIGASGSGSTLSWSASNTPQTFNHGLLRQPIGFIVAFKNKTCDIYCPTTPTKDIISLANTDASATTIVMVF